jgi:hypothetical protein
MLIPDQLRAGRETAWRRLRRFCQRARRSRLAQYCCLGGVPLLVVILLGSACCVDMSGASEFQPVSVSTAAAAPCQPTGKDGGLIHRAETDPVGLLEEGLRRHDENLRDYEGVFSCRQDDEGRPGRLIVCRFKFRSEPFSVLMHWVQGVGRIDKLLYVQGQNDGKMIVHPTGLTGRLISSVAVDPHGEQARKGGQRPVTQFGLRNALRRILEAYKEDAKEGSLQASCLGLGELSGERVITLQKTSDGEKLIVDLQTRTLLPVRIRQHDRDGRLVAFYQYSDLRFNAGLTDEEFTKEANGL